MDTNTHIIATMVATSSCNSSSIRPFKVEAKAFSLNFATDQNSCFNNQHYNIDIFSTDNISVSAIGGYLFWDVTTSNTSSKHQSIFWCSPRLIFIGQGIGRGDDSTYNRLFGSKAIIAVLSGFLPPTIAKSCINTFHLVHTSSGDQNLLDLRPFCLRSFNSGLFDFVLGLCRGVLMTACLFFASLLISLFAREEGNYA